MADRVLVAPVERRDHPLVADAAFQVAEAELGEPVEHQAAEARRLLLPVQPLGAGIAQVRHRHQQVQRGMAGRRHGRVDDAGVVQIEAGLVGQDAGLQLADVPLIALGQHHRVMRKLRVGSLDAEIEHEGRTRIARGLDLLVGPARPQLLRHQLRHGMREIGVDDHRVGRMVNAAHAQPGRPLALEGNVLDGRIEAELDPQPLGDAGHCGRDAAAAALDVPDPMLIFEEAEDGEEAGAAERRHPQVFGLEGEGEPHQRMAEMPAEILVDRGMRPQQRQAFQHLRMEEAEDRLERLLQDRAEDVQLGAVLGDEGAEALGIGRAELGDLGFHPHRVGGGVDALRRTFEEQPIQRVDADQLRLVLQPRADALEDLGDDAGIEEEGRAEVEAIAFRRHLCAGPAADDLVLLEDGDLGALRGQQHGGGKPAGTGADDSNARTAGLQGRGSERGVHARRIFLHTIMGLRQMRLSALTARVMHRNKRQPCQAAGSSASRLSAASISATRPAALGSSRAR